MTNASTRLSGTTRAGSLCVRPLSTGLRRAEICDLVVSDLHIGNGRRHLVVRRGKGGKTCTVHLGKQSKAVSHRYLLWKAENNELTPDAYRVRSSKSEKYTPTALWKMWRKVRAERAPPA